MPSTRPAPDRAILSASCRWRPGVWSSTRCTCHRRSWAICHRSGTAPARLPVAVRRHRRRSVQAERRHAARSRCPAGPPPPGPRLLKPGSTGTPPTRQDVDERYLAGHAPPQAARSPPAEVRRMQCARWSGSCGLPTARRRVCPFRSGWEVWSSRAATLRTLIDWLDLSTR